METVTNPISHMSWISLTIDELINDVNSDQKDNDDDTHERTVFPEPATKQSVAEKRREMIHARRPWIQSRPPVDFHFLKMSP